MALSNKFSHKSLKVFYSYKYTILTATVICCVLFLGDVRNFIWKYVYIEKLDLKSLSLNETAWGFPYEYESSREYLKEDVRVSEIYPNCGLAYPCPDNTFPVHIYTGQDKDDQPKLCVGGRYLGGVGRGLNIAVIESKHLQILSLQNFDLYSHNSSTLESWLVNDLHDDDLIIAFTFDEASKELSKKAKTILYHLGSGKIQDLQFRSQWYMISQKGIDGFTPLENITYAKNDHWGEVINEKMCVPRKIVPTTISPDPLLRHSPLKEALCQSSSELECEEFCNPLSRHEPYIPSLLTNRTLIGNVAFSTPVIVLASNSLSTLVITLETVVYQPGIHPSTVVIVHTDRQTEVPTLGKLFGFRTLKLNSTLYYETNNKIYFGLRYVSEVFPKKKYAIVLEEDLILSPDFLFYMAQIAPIMEQDSSVLGVSAWNPYGYIGVSGNTHLAYRVENFPGLGFMIPLKLFHEQMKENMHQCCTKKTFEGWTSILETVKGGHIIMPDVSRVLKCPKDQYRRSVFDNEFEVFTKPRLTNTDMNAWIERPQDLLSDRYFQRIANLIQSSITFYLTNEDIKLCENGSNIAINIMLSELKNKVFTAYIKEENCHSTERMKAYLKCFGIFLPAQSKLQNMYEGILRFTVNTNTVLLIGFNSPFAKNKSRTQNFT